MKAKERINSRERRKLSLSLAAVAKCYRGGSTRERIRQIEAGISVSREVERDYRAAVAAAVEEHTESQNILRIARALARTL